VDRHLGDPGEGVAPGRKCHVGGGSRCRRQESRDQFSRRARRIGPRRRTTTNRITRTRPFPCMQQSWSRQGGRSSRQPRARSDLAAPSMSPGLYRAVYSRKEIPYFPGKVPTPRSEAPDVGCSGQSSADDGRYRVIDRPSRPDGRPPRRARSCGGRCVRGTSAGEADVREDRLLEPFGTNSCAPRGCSRSTARLAGRQNSQPSQLGL